MDSSSASCVLCNSNESKVIFKKDGYDLCKCQQCGLVFVGNPPTLDELKKIYSFDSGYHTGFRDDVSLQKQYTDYAEKNYSLIEQYVTPGRVLDVGCSAGFFLNVARNKGWQGYGLELSHDTAELARSRFGLNINVGTLDDGFYEPDFFDLVTLWDVIEHVHDPLRTMRHVHSLLHEGGAVAISTPNIDGFFPKLSYIVSSLIQRWLHPEPPFHLFQFSVTTITRLLHLSGFEVVSVHHGAIPVSYTFGTMGSLLRAPLKLGYSLVFAPTVLIGPIVNAGDWIVIVAKKRTA